MALSVFHSLDYSRNSAEFLKKYDSPVNENGGDQAIGRRSGLHFADSDPGRGVSPRQDPRRVAESVDELGAKDKRNGSLRRRIHQNGELWGARPNLT